ncbi:MAG: tyrosine--tRNA ligase [Bacteroidetes bacterium]|nr:MAG: tyrosine--tRNA ligase [Bacteroidota bacterium]
MNLIEELRWRGMIHDMMPGTEAYLNEHRVAGYLGVDPTSDSMHIGNLVPVMMLVHLQRAGHKPIALVGGATGMVGDPSGKDKERNLLSLEQIQHNVAGIKKQLEHFLDFEAPDNPAEVVNNYDWLGQMGFLEFLREVGKHVTINYMTSKESVRKRMEGENGISYTEFAYQLLQGYDYLYLYEHKGVRIQLGGSDQWGNITTGTELIRRKLGSETHAFAVVCPLLTREDGSKFGKSADGSSVWLDANRTSPYEFYQYWIQSADADAERYIHFFTLKTREEIEALITAHREAPHLRGLQTALAEDITLRVHGEEGLRSARALTEFLFARNTEPEALAALSVPDWEAIVRAAPDTLSLPRTRLEAGMGILDLLTELGITQSKGEARRAIEKDRSIRINALRCESIEQEVGLDTAFHGRFLQLQKGKKQRFIVELTT